MNKILLFFVILLSFSNFGFSQTEVDLQPVVEFTNGIGFHTPDSLFATYIRFRMQNRIALYSNSDKDIAIDQVEARIRRLRLRFDGFMLSNKLNYTIQLAFSRADQDWDKSHVPNIIRDAMIFYRLNHSFTFALGQGKLPGNRQQMISSGLQQFAERAIVNSTFSIDRDFGFFSTISNHFGSLFYNLKTAISTGEGRNSNTSDNGLAYTGRLELLPTGTFTNNSDFIEGDLYREPKPKVSIAFGYSLNKKATKTGGQTGYDLNSPVDINTTFADIVYKYQGFAISSEFMQRYTKNPVSAFETGDTVYVYNGYGINNQFSYLFHSMNEFEFRFSLLRPDGKTKDFELPKESYTLGHTIYINKHKTKVQTNLIYNRQKNNDGSRSGSFCFMFQIELGI